MKLNLRKKSKGFTLVEILLVVGFIALASIGIYAVYNKVTTTSKANEENRNLQTLKTGIKQLYGNQGTFTGLTETVIRNSRLAPQQMNTGTAGGLINMFGGSVTIAPLTFGSFSGFRITSNEIPGDVCVKLVAATSGTFEQITAAGTIVKPIGANNPPNPATITTACNADKVTMLFDSY
jgi:type II secretory pathway pseudopilin PulG